MLGIMYDSRSTIHLLRSHVFDVTFFKFDRVIIVIWYCCNFMVLHFFAP
jgi:hypothetical protein